ncbi:MAG: hypothetical protein UU81_C0012G0002 [Microgenomates group bacterium GW2011_GWC1_41_8]|nr:MAG: hypothetical protein UU81_C0012G0002 [Microgenomates group bacterium GW2011_GWC1_41_8]
MNEFTKQEKADILQGLNASIKRLRGKIKNDEIHERHDYNRITWLKEKIERARLLIEKLTINGEEETINGTGERRLRDCS